MVLSLDFNTVVRKITVEIQLSRITHFCVNVNILGKHIHEIARLLHHVVTNFWQWLIRCFFRANFF